MLEIFTLSLDWLIIMGGLVLFGGVVSAISGGSGLFVVPALVLAGLSPVQALGLDKLFILAGSWGLINYIHKDRIEWDVVVYALPGAVLGGLLGGYFALSIPAEILTYVVIGLSAVFVVLLIKAPLAHTDNEAWRFSPRPYVKAGILAFFLSMYIGFFSPGGGTLGILLATFLLGMPLVYAVTFTMCIGVVSSLVSFGLFQLHGEIVWAEGLLFTALYGIGSWYGSHLAIKRGSALIRSCLFLSVLVILAALILKKLGVGV